MAEYEYNGIKTLSDEIAAINMTTFGKAKVQIMWRMHSHYFQS
jgi:hypothetical protein